MDLMSLFLIFIIGFFSAIIGITVGSSDFIRIPLLVMLGLPPKVAVASNKVGAILKNIVGIYKYGKTKHINSKLGFLLVIFEFIGAIIGAKILLNINDSIIGKVVAIALFIVVILPLLKKNLGVKKKEKISKKKLLIGVILFFLLSIFKGAIGGTGIFQTYILATLFGLTFLECAGTRRIPNLISALTSVFIFSFHKIINWEVGIVLLISEGLGAYVGATLALKKGNKFVRRLFITVGIILSIVVLYNSFI